MIDVMSTEPDPLLAQFESEFESFRETAFRFEALPSYFEPSEHNFFESFRRGDPCPDELNKEWLDLVALSLRSGKEFTRVRWVCDPISEYIRFEATWGYTQSVRAGEQILVERGGNLAAFAGDVPVLKDFWLFDEQRCYLMNYDLLGRFLGVESVPSGSIEKYRVFAHALQKHAVPFDPAPFKS
jgi:hypothetical protein